MAEVRESRGTYRSIHSVLIDSPEFVALSDEAKLLFYTIRCCPENNLACIFSPFYLETYKERLKMPPKDLRRAFQELQAGDTPWIGYQKPIVWVRNGLRYAPEISLANPLHASAVQKILRGLPKLQIVLDFCSYYKISCPFDTLSIPYGIQELNPNPNPEKELNPNPNTPHTPQGGLNGFQAFWERYPQKEGIGKAEEAWSKHTKGIPLDDIMAGVVRWEQSQKWADGFIPMPATWLNQKRWRDNPRPVKAVSSAGQQTLDAAKRLIQRKEETKDAQ